MYCTLVRSADRHPDRAPPYTYLCGVMQPRIRSAARMRLVEVQMQMQMQMHLVAVGSGCKSHCLLHLSVGRYVMHCTTVSGEFVVLFGPAASLAISLNAKEHWN